MHAGQPVYEDLDIRNGGTSFDYNSNLAYKNTSRPLVILYTLTYSEHMPLYAQCIKIVFLYIVNGSGDLAMKAEQDFTSHNYQEIGNL